jgi:ribonuclease J
MDKIDEWLERTFDGEDSEQKSKNPQKAKNKNFQKRQPSRERNERPSSTQKKNNNFVSRGENAKQHNAAKQAQPAKLAQAKPHAQARPKPHPANPQHSAAKPQHPAAKRAAHPAKQTTHKKYIAAKRIAPKKAPAKPPSPILRGKLKIIPLGGLDEVGKNMMALEYEDDIIIIDMGLEFPSDDMLGIDYVIPDTTYLEENKKRIRAVILTHGHLDHIGGIPYILPKLNFPPVYGTKLTLGLVQKRIEEFKQEKMTQLREINPDQPLKLGKFLLKFFRVAHSIPDAIGMIIDTPIGKIVHTGDFKFDDSPAGNQKVADIEKIKALGSQNVLALFSDSTNSLKPGHTMSESEVGKTLEDLIKNTKGRLIIASFSSLIGRIQQILNYAEKHNRKVFISGRSLLTNIDIAMKLGYLKCKPGNIQDIKKYKDKMSDSETLILTTGSQGESVSALTRIANQDHSKIKIKKGDTIVLSSSPIIGNERAICSVVNNLCKLGATVIHNQIKDVHTSGHGYREELKQMIRMVKPKYLLPVHGEYFMRQEHARLAQQHCDIPRENTILLQNGDVLIAEKDKVSVSPEKVDTKYILIDGSGEGQIGSQVQIDRQIMSQNGSLVVLVHINRKTKKLKKTPDVVSRGFIYMHETEEIAREIAEVAGGAYKRIHDKIPNAKRQEIKKYIKQTVDKYTRVKLERRPLIVPLIIEN